MFTFITTADKIYNSLFKKREKKERRALRFLPATYTTAEQLGRVRRVKVRPGEGVIALPYEPS